VLSLVTPRLNGHSGDTADGSALNQLAANSEIDQRIALGVKQTRDTRFLEKQRGAFAEGSFLFRQFALDHYRPNLLTGNRKLGRIFGNAKRALEAAGLGLADMASDALHFGIIKGLHAHFMVGTDQFPSRHYATNFLRVCGGHPKTEKQGTVRKFLFHVNSFGWLIDIPIVTAGFHCG
jgi:hypothetical protein